MTTLCEFSPQNILQWCCIHEYCYIHEYAGALAKDCGHKTSKTFVADPMALFSECIANSCNVLRLQGLKL